MSKTPAYAYAVTGTREGRFFISKYGEILANVLVANFAINI